MICALNRFIFPTPIALLLIDGNFFYGIWHHSFIIDQSSVSVAHLHQIRILVSLMLLVAVCADGAVRVFRIDDTSSKSFK